MCIRKNRPQANAVHQNKLTPGKVGDGCQTKFFWTTVPRNKYAPSKRATVQMSSEQMAKDDGARAPDKWYSKKCLNKMWHAKYKHLDNWALHIKFEIAQSHFVKYAI